MWRTASPLVPGLGRAHHHRTHTTEALAASVSERPAQQNFSPPHQQIERGIASVFFLAFQAEPLQGAAPLVSSSCSCCASYLPQAGSVGHADW
jgi:hypothetical protein